MKYHYKTPEELQRDLARPPQKKFTFFASKTSLIVFLDLVLILLVAGILYYHGFFARTSVVSRSTETHAGLEMSASISGMDGEKVALTLHVRNPGAQAIAFPPPELQNVRIEVFHRDELIASEALTLTAVSMEPYQSQDLPLAFTQPDGIPHFHAALYLVFSDRILRLELPPVQTKRKHD